MNQLFSVLLKNPAASRMEINSETLCGYAPQRVGNLYSVLSPQSSVLCYG